MTTTLYKHQIFCLHGIAGVLAAAAAATDSTITVTAAVIADVTIAIGSQIQLDDGVNLSPILTIMALDSMLNTLTLNQAVGYAYPTPSSTNVKRTPHAVTEWTESPNQLTTCPEDPSHPIQAGSGITLEIRAPTEAKIIQSDSSFTHPEAWGQQLDVDPGQTGTVEFSWPYPVTVRGIVGYFTQSNDADRFDVLSAPDTLVGQPTVTVGAGATVISVSGTALTAARPSLMCELTEGGTTDNLGRIVSVDSGAGTITVATATTHSFTTSAFILYTAVHTENMPIPEISNALIEMGTDQLLGKDVPANTIIRIVYRNSGPSASKALALIKILT